MEHASGAADTGNSIQKFSEANLAAHVAVTLDPPRRAVVEGFLACNPDMAARLVTAMMVPSAICQAHRNTWTMS